MALGLFIWGQTNLAFSFCFNSHFKWSSNSTLEIGQEGTSRFYLPFEWTFEWTFLPAFLSPRFEVLN